MGETLFIIYMIHIHLWGKPCHFHCPSTLCYGGNPINYLLCMQITATCMSLVNPGRYLVQRRGSRVLSPPPSSITGIPSLTLSNPDNSSLQVLSEEDYHHSDNLFGRESLEDNQTAESAKRGGSLGDVVSPSSVVVEKSPTRRGSGDLAGHVSHHTSPYLQRQYSSGGERHMMRRTSPGLLGEEESPKCEIWVASSNAFHSTVTVIDYTHRFANIEVQCII